MSTSSKGEGCQKGFEGEKGEGGKLEAAKKGARPSARRGNFYQAAKLAISRKVTGNLVGQSLLHKTCKAHLTAKGVTLARPRARRLAKVGWNNLEQIPRQMIKIS